MLCTFLFLGSVPDSWAPGVIDHEVNSATNPAEPPPTEQSIISFNDRLTRLHAALSQNTALIVLTGHSDPRQAIQLNARKTNFDRLYKGLGPEGISKLKPEDGWSSENERELVRVVEEARTGLAFFCVKGSS